MLRALENGVFDPMIGEVETDWFGRLKKSLIPKPR